MRRHYGWWDIPLKHIKQESTSFTFDFKNELSAWITVEDRLRSCRAGAAPLKKTDIACCISPSGTNPKSRPICWK